MIVNLIDDHSYVYDMQLLGLRWADAHVRMNNYHRVGVNSSSQESLVRDYNTQKLVEHTGVFVIHNSNKSSLSSF